MTGKIAVVSISGGKDSTATALCAIGQYGRERVRLVFADTGNEHPLTLEYVHGYLPGALGIEVETARADFTRVMAGKRKFVAEKWPGHGVPADRVARALEILQPTGNPFLDLCMWKGRFPSRKAQFCTQELKRLPLDRHMLSLISAGLEVESWQGVRRGESLARRNALDEEYHDLGIGTGWWVKRPIAAWTAADVFAYCAAQGVEMNPLYRKGMKRVGCMPCINCGKDELLEISRRFPAEIARIAEWETLVAEASKRGFGTFFANSDFDGDSNEPNSYWGIGSAVDWARTSRGGVQFDWLRDLPRAECSSVYGLCE